MECLLFLSWNFALYLACYHGTCLCMNNVYGWHLLMYEQCVWMKLMWYVIWKLCAGYVIYICCENCWSKKTKKKRQYAGSLPSATDGKEIFAISSGRQRGHMAGNCASWEVDQFGQFANSGWRQRLCRPQRTAKALPCATDGKGLPLTT